MFEYSFEYYSICEKYSFKTSITVSFLNMKNNRFESID